MYEKLFNLLISILTLLAGGEKRYRKKILDMAGIKQVVNEKILDLCCGTGTLTRLISQQIKGFGGFVIGVDYCPEILGLACKRTRDYQNLSYQIADARSLPFKDNYFAQVFICMALHEMYIEERIIVINEIYRVLKNNGIGIFVDFDQPRKPGLQYKLVTRIEEFMDKEAFGDFKSYKLKEEIEKAGFEIKKTDLALGNCIQIIVAQSIEHRA